MIALNAVFDWQLLLADEGYESSSDTIDLPTPLRKTPRIHHVSSIKHALFDPESITPWNALWTPPRIVCRQLSFSSSDDDNTPGDTPPTPRATPASTPEYLEDKEEEEDFKWYPWTMIIGPLRKYQIEHCVYMNMPYHMGYAHIHALMWTTKFLHT